MNELKGQPERIGFIIILSAWESHWGAFKGGSDRVRGASVKMAPAVGRRMCWWSGSGYAHHSGTCPSVAFYGHCTDWQIILSLAIWHFTAERTFSVNNVVLRLWDFIQQ